MKTIGYIAAGVGALILTSFAGSKLASVKIARKPKATPATS